MNTFNYINTKFLAIKGDLSNTVSGGTAMLKSDFFKNEKKYIIETKLATVDPELLSIELLEDKVIISSSLQTVSNKSVVFNMPFASQTFDIPKNVNQGRIEAYTKNGALIIELPISNTRSSRDHSNVDINFDDDF